MQFAANNEGPFLAVVQDRTSKQGEARLSEPSPALDFVLTVKRRFAALAEPTRSASSIVALCRSLSPPWRLFKMSKKCSVEGCGTWSFQDGYCRDHLKKVVMQSSDASHASSAASTPNIRPRSMSLPSEPDAVSSLQVRVVDSFLGSWGLVRRCVILAVLLSPHPMSSARYNCR